MSKNSNSSAFWGSKIGFIVKNLLVAIALGVIVLIVLVNLMKQYTHHGEEVEVPQVTGLYLEEAQVLLESSGLQLKVIDSTFSNKVPLGTIVEQNPPKESHAKKGRAVYVVLNARAPQRVAIPNLQNMSYRQAENNLIGLGLIVDSMEYEPSEYRDLVLDLRKGEESLETGDMIEVGSHLVMVVGFGKGTEMMDVPNLRGLPLREARRRLLEAHFILGQYSYDDQPTEKDKDEFVVYFQEPDAGNKLLEGSSIRVMLSKDLEKAVTTQTTNDEEEFF